jgi:hypothetical protein
MFIQSKQRVFVPLMLVGFLFTGAMAAEASDRGGDRVVRGAAVGAAVGTFLQIVQGRTEGHQLLAGAVVGGTLGAVVGTYNDARYDRYGRRGDTYYRDGYYGRDANYGRDRYYREGSTYRDRDGRYGAYDSRDRAYDSRDGRSYCDSDRDDRYHRETYQRYDSRYRHH